MTHYDTLGIPEKATGEEIKKAWGKLRALNDPDKHPEHKKVYEAHVIKLDAAHEVLRSQEKRAVYDAKLAAERAAQEAKQNAAHSTNTSAGSQSQSAPNSNTGKQRSGPRYKKTSSRHSGTHTQSTPAYSNPATYRSGLRMWMFEMKKRLNVLLKGLLLFIGQVSIGYLTYKIITALGASSGNALVSTHYFIENFFTETFVGLLLLFVVILLLLKVVDYILSFKQFRAASYLVAAGCFIVFLSGTSPTTSLRVIDFEDISGQESVATVITEGIPYLENFQEMKQTLSKDEVLDLQRVLAHNPDVYPEGLVTGFYGELTHRALIRFQEKYNLPAEGYYGGDTRATVKELSKSADTAEQTVVTPVTTPIVAMPSTKAPDFLTIRLVNQYGIPYAVGANFNIKEITLKDELGEVVQGSFEGVPNDSYHMRFNKVLSDKKYTIAWPVSDRSSEDTTRYYNGGSQVIAYKADQIKPYDIIAKQVTQTIKRKEFITMRITNEVDTPLKVSYYNLNVFGPNDEKVGSFKEVSPRGAEISYVFQWNNGGSVYGEHTLKIDHPGYETKTVSFTIPNAMSLTDAQIAALPPIDLGNIVLTKE